MQALEGLRVLEVGNIVAGPFCGTLMADFGADVIKVEPPGSGDIIRSMGRVRDMWYCVEARNKRNITLNLKTEKGKELFRALAEKADILVENFRPGVFARLGFSWEELHRLNPRLIYVCVSGFGQTGPLAARPCMDRIALAAGGFLQVTGYPDRAPVKPGVSSADFSTAMLACVGAMFAVYSRDVLGTGQGQQVDCALTESVLRMQESILAEYSYDGTVRERTGNSAVIAIPSGHFPTKDGQYLVVTMSGEKLFRTCMTAIGREDVLENPEYQSLENRVAHREELNGILADWVAKRTLAECLAVLEDKVPCHKVFSAADILKDPQFRARGALTEVDTEEFGPLTMQNVVPRLSGTPGRVNWEGKRMGYFNSEIYRGVLGVSEAELKKLAADGVI